MQKENSFVAETPTLLPDSSFKHRKVRLSPQNEVIFSPLCLIAARASKINQQGVKVKFAIT